MFQSIWMMVTGTNRIVNQIEVQSGAQAAALAQIQKALADLKAIVLQNQAILLKIQAELTPPPAVALVIKVGGTTQGENGMLKVADTGSVSATLEADDALGNAGASLDGPPAWSSSDTSIATVQAAADGMSAAVTLTGKLGQFTLSVAATAGGKAISATSDTVEVDPGAAASLKIALTAQ